jgi:replication initiation and membrane attachment protein DnaB
MIYQGFALGVIAAIVGYVMLRGAAKFLLSPLAADWMDQRAKTAKAESDAVAAAQEAFLKTSREWGAVEVSDGE